MRSVARAVIHAGVEPLVTSDPLEVGRAGVLIVPGVGAAGDTMRNLRERGLDEPIRKHIASGRPFLGVCMGLQVLFDLSEEGGEHPCLGVIPGRVVRFPARPGLKVPHMGWNQVWQTSKEHPIFNGIPDGAYFYFVHSYFARPSNSAQSLGFAEYGVTFPAIIGIDNLVATQFHPEKSGQLGLRMYENFLGMAAELRIA